MRDSSVFLKQRFLWCFSVFSISKNRVFRVFPCFRFSKIVFFAFFRTSDSQKSCFLRFFVLLILKNRVFCVFSCFWFSKIVFFAFFRFFVFQKSCFSCFFALLCNEKRFFTKYFFKNILKNVFHFPSCRVQIKSTLKTV